MTTIDFINTVASNSSFPGVGPGTLIALKNDALNAIKKLVFGQSPNTFTREQFIPQFQTFTGKEIMYGAARGMMVAKNELPSTTNAVIFQFNPAPLIDSKVNMWTSSNTPGMYGERDIWASGKPRSLRFTLNFDATAASNTRLTAGMPTNSGITTPANYQDGDGTQYGTAASDNLNPSTGTTVQTELLMSFAYPVLRDPSATRFIKGNYTPYNDDNLNQFSSPPVIVFIYGNYYLECRLHDVEITHLLFNKLLVPVRSSAEITLTVIEGFSINTDINLQQTLQGLSTVATTVITN